MQYPSKEENFFSFSSEEIYLANKVVFSPGDSSNSSIKAINGVRGGGCTSGSLDVYSLDYSNKTFLVLEWEGKKVVDGPGIDFIVFENPFDISSCGSSSRFMDHVVVEVSRDLIHWCGFSPDYTYPDETLYSNDPQYWKRVAGKAPVLWNVDSNPLSLEEIFQDLDGDYEMDLAGGDGFDLALLTNSTLLGENCTSFVKEEIQNLGFYYIKLSPLPLRINPDTGTYFPRDSISNGPDIDGVVARYVTSR